MITVTGATGLLGSRLLFDLLTTTGDKILALKRKTSDIQAVRKIFSYYTDNPDELFERIEWKDFDILDIVSVTESLQNTSYLYHAAAYVSFNPRDRRKMMLFNVKGTANIVNACLELPVRKICYVSSTSALGSAPQDEFVSENLIWTPDKMNTGYSVSKFKSEMEVWRGIEEGLKAVIVNPSIIFGPGFWDKGSSSMFSAVNKGLRFYTNGVTGFVSVKDVSDCMIRLMNSDISGERFIISSENLCYKDVLDMIAEQLRVKKPGMEATPFLAELASSLDAIRALFTGKRIITREAAYAGMKKVYLSNEKIKNAVGMEFQKMEGVIQELGEIFLKEE